MGMCTAGHIQTWNYRMEAILQRFDAYVPSGDLFGFAGCRTLNE